MDRCACAPSNPGQRRGGATERSNSAPAIRLGSAARVFYGDAVSGFLRFVGVVNGAVWLGAGVFFTLVAGPTFFSPAMMQALQHKYYAGLAAQVMIQQYFLLQLWCAAIGLIHMLAEWLYLGRPFGRVRVALWLGMVLLALFGGVGVQPKLRALHQTMYHAATVEERLSASRAFRLWHGVSQTANLLVLAGMLAYFWRVLNPPDTTRFAPLGKLRS